MLPGCFQGMLSFLLHIRGPMSFACKVQSGGGAACLWQSNSSGVLQGLKPQWPADDCYHSCCSGEAAAPSVSAVPSGRKAGAGALASAAKEAAKEIVRAAEDGAGKARRRLQPMELGSAKVENPTSTPFRSILADILHDGFSCGLRMCFFAYTGCQGRQRCR